MRSRMERYSEPMPKTIEHTRREEKNKGLYDHLYTNTTYTEYKEENSANAVELTALKNSYRTREGYQRIKEYQGIMTPPKVKRDLDRFQELYPSDENKVYDINSILQEAKKNRSDIDELEHKRKLRSTQYNILADLDVETIEKYNEIKKERRVNPKIEESEIKELIDTITSKTLRKEIEEKEEEDLMSDLLPKNLEETIIKDSFSKEVFETTSSSELANMDKSFYTKSMDLSDQDFETDDEFKEIEEKSVPLFVKVPLFLILVAILTTILYFLINRL